MVTNLGYLSREITSLSNMKVTPNHWVTLINLSRKYKKQKISLTKNSESLPLCRGIIVVLSVGCISAIFSCVLIRVTMNYCDKNLKLTSETYSLLMG